MATLSLRRWLPGWTAGRAEQTTREVRAISVRCRRPLLCRLLSREEICGGRGVGPGIAAPSERRWFRRGGWPWCCCHFRASLSSPGPRPADGGSEMAFGERLPGTIPQARFGERRSQSAERDAAGQDGLDLVQRGKDTSLERDKIGVGGQAFGQPGNLVGERRGVGHSASVPIACENSAILDRITSYNAAHSCFPHI